MASRWRCDSNLSTKRFPPKSHAPETGGSRTEHQPINLCWRFGSNHTVDGSITPTPTTPFSSNPGSQCRVKPPGVHKHRRIPNRASRHAKISSTCPHRRVDPTSSGRPACSRSRPVPHSMPPLAHNWLPVTEIFFAFDTLAASPSPTPKKTRASQRAQMPHPPLSNHHKGKSHHRNTYDGQVKMD